MTSARWVLATVAFANLVVAALHFGLAASAPLLRSELGLDASQLGLLLAAPAVGLMLGTFMWGELADRFSERLVLGGAFVGFAAASATAAAAYERGALEFGAAILVAGAFGSAAHSAGGRAISAAWPVERHGLVLSIRHTAIPLGGAIGGVCVPLLARSEGVAQAIAVMAVLGAVAAVGIMLAVPSIVLRSDEATADDVEAGRSPLRDRTMWLLCAGCASMAFVQLGVGSFLTVQLVGAAKVDLAIAVWVFTAAQLVGAAGRIVLGIWSDRASSRVAVLRTVAIVALLLLAPTLLGATDLADGILYALAVVAVTMSNGVSVAAAASFAPAGRTGATLGMQTTCNAAAAAVAPIVLGLLLEHAGWRGFEACVIAVLLVGVGSLSLLVRSSRAAAR